MLFIFFPLSKLSHQLTFSPISVWSPPGSISKSCFKAQASTTF